MPRLGITAYDLLISCPGDVSKYIEVVRECVESFNKTLGVVNNSEIATRHWSTDSYPQSGDKPQELLNKQFVRDCDAAVAIFWTKFGTPTDKYGSGTEEEIEEMLSSGKQVFMYFVDEPVNPSNVDLEQYKKINEFKEKYKDRGIYVTVKNDNELRKEFTNHLAMHFLPLMMDKGVISEKKLNPVLKVYGDSFSENATIRHTSLSECKLIVEKKQKIISQIEVLNKEPLKERDKIEQKEDNKNNALNNGQLDIQRLIGNMDILSGQLTDAEIPENWKEEIIAFTQANTISVKNEFWNVGNLKKRVKMVVPMYGGNGITIDGTEEEKQRYSDIEDLYWSIKEYNEYHNLFSSIDKQDLVNLVLTNKGNTYDEDIDVKLFFKKGEVATVGSFVIPGMNIMEEVLKMGLLEYVYTIDASDTIDEYSGYPIQKPSFNYNPSNILGGPSLKEEYESNKYQYENRLERLFCYRTYEKEDGDVISFHVDYLKHNTSMAFPSVLVFDDVPETIEYEITSKHISEVIKGKVILK